MQNKKVIINKIHKFQPGIKKISLHKSTRTGITGVEDFISASGDSPNKMPASRTVLSRTVMEGHSAISAAKSGALFEDWPPPTKMLEFI